MRRVSLVVWLAVLCLSTPARSSTEYKGCVQRARYMPPQRLLQQSDADSTPVDEQKMPPPPPEEVVDVAPAHVMTVSSPATLQQAIVTGTQDIEITAHMDLRVLTLLLNPYHIEADDVVLDPGVPPGNFTHTLYSNVPTRSIRGNCTSRSGNQTEALVRQLPELTAGRVEYPPLKPFQCVLVIDKPFLWHNNGSLWIDNIYLAVSRKNVMPEFSMVQYGSLKHHLDGVGGNSIYITNTTFVGEGRGDARAIHSGEKKASILVEDAVFSSFTGFKAPLLFAEKARAVVRNSSFRDFFLQEEIFDVSHGSGVQLENCTFTNITVPDNEYVSTSYSDYFFWGLDGYSDAIVYLQYYADQDVNPLFDIPRVRANDSNAPDDLVDTRVSQGTMSDCLAWYESHMPGCPEPQSTRLKELYAKRAAQAHGADPEEFVRDGAIAGRPIVNISAPPVPPPPKEYAPPDVNIDYFPPGYFLDSPDVAVPYDGPEPFGFYYEYIDFPDAMFLASSDPWLLRMQQVLPLRGAPPADFDPVFDPPARDPRRDLPRRITAGTDIPPAATSSAPSSSAISLENQTGEEDSKGWSAGRRAAAIIAATASLALLLWALFALLLRRHCSKKPADSPGGCANTHSDGHKSKQLDADSTQLPTSSAIPYPGFRPDHVHTTTVPIPTITVTDAADTTIVPDSSTIGMSPGAGDSAGDVMNPDYEYFIPKLLSLAEEGVAAQAPQGAFPTRSPPEIDPNSSFQSKSVSTDDPNTSSNTNTHTKTSSSATWNTSSNSTYTHSTSTATPDRMSLAIWNGSPSEQAIDSSSSTSSRARHKFRFQHSGSLMQHAGNLPEAGSLHRELSEGQKSFSSALGYRAEREAVQEGKTGQEGIAVLLAISHAQRDSLQPSSQQSSFSHPSGSQPSFSQPSLNMRSTSAGSTLPVMTRNSTPPSPHFEPGVQPQQGHTTVLPMFQTPSSSSSNQAGDASAEEGAQLEARKDSVAFMAPLPSVQPQGDLAAADAAPEVLISFDDVMRDNCEIVSSMWKRRSSMRDEYQDSDLAGSVESVVQQQQMKLAEGPDLGEFAASMPSDSLVVQPLTGTSSRPAEEVQEQAQPHHTQQHDVAQAKWDICQELVAPMPDVALIVGANSAAMDERIKALVKQLDSFRSKDLFLKRFRMLGRNERRRGGQGVVQFAQGVRDGSEYAVKFFLDEESFYAEAALYVTVFTHLKEWLSERAADAMSHLAAPTARTAGTSEGEGVPDPVQVLQAAGARFLPQVEALRDGVKGELVDPSGNALPPCIVMERGESLQEWANRAEPDLFTSLALLSNLADRLSHMHAAGFVHRDLKPANVMWLPRENRWTVIDFGSVSRVGTSASLSYTLAYAAPEVVRASQAGIPTTVTSTALDSWSLGVMAFELLTGAPAFRLLTDGREQVVAQLRGDAPLPWEGDMPAHVHRQLGAFREPVLQLLKRNPVDRISMHRFHALCTRVVANRSSSGDET